MESALATLISRIKPQVLSIAWLAFACQESEEKTPVSALQDSQ